MTPMTPNKKNAFTLIEVLIALNIIGVLMVIAIPNLIRARALSQAKACSRNLMLIDRSKQQWALDNKISNTNTTVPTFTQLVGPSLYIKSTPTCPTNGTYTIGNINTDPSCNNDITPNYRHTVTGF